MPDPPTVEEVVKWGYDEDFRLSEQDEDLLLHSTEYVPALIKLVDDPDCPKDYFAFSILCEFTREMFLKNNEKEMRDIIKIKEKTTKGKEPSEYVRKWADYVGRLHDYFYEFKPIDKERAARMARDLLVGIDRLGQPSEPKLYGDTWQMCLETSAKEYLCIDRNDGTWRYSMFYPCVGRFKKLFGWVKIPWEGWW